MSGPRLKWVKTSPERWRTIDAPYRELEVNRRSGGGSKAPWGWRYLGSPTVVFNYGEWDRENAQVESEKALAELIRELAARAARELGEGS